MQPEFCLDDDDDDNLISGFVTSTPERCGGFFPEFSISISPIRIDFTPTVVHHVAHANPFINYEAKSFHKPVKSYSKPTETVMSSHKPLETVRSLPTPIDTVKNNYQIRQSCICAMPAATSNQMSVKQHNILVKNVAEGDKQKKIKCIDLDETRGRSIVYVSDHVPGELN